MKTRLIKTCINTQFKTKSNVLYDNIKQSSLLTAIL